MNRNRILSVTLKNIKNVGLGTIEFPECDRIEKGIFSNNSSSVLGIYGQNGSGKTSVVNVFSALKDLSLGRSLYKFSDGQKRVIGEIDYLLNVNAEIGGADFVFLIYSEDKPYMVTYSFMLRRNQDNFVCLSKESVTIYSYHEKGKPFKRPFAPLEIDYENPIMDFLYDGVRHEENTKRVLPERDSPEYKDLIDYSAKVQYCKDSGTSLLFSGWLLNYLERHPKANVQEVANVLKKLTHQLVFNLFVFSSRTGASVHFGVSLISGAHRNKENGDEIHGMFFLSDKPFNIKEDQLKTYEDILQQTNRFISVLVPEFCLKLNVLESKTLEDGSSGKRIEIYRSLGDKKLPLSEESAGIKLLVALASALIQIYGNPSIWLIVDELDSGVFENVWGQIVEVLEREGSGQLLFTAHNLAPLERIPSTSIVFTTSNPNNRYIKYKGVRHTNNLRDLYLRALVLGGQKEPLANDMDEQDIGAALCEAYQDFSRGRVANE